MTTIIMTPDNRARLHLASLRYYCRIYAAGMVSRQVPATQVKSLVELATGQKFKRGEWNKMASAIGKLLEAGNE